MRQRNKDKMVKTLGVMQSRLPIPTHVWTYIYIDFKVVLPRAINKSMIMVEVDCLSKYAHFCFLFYSFTSSLVAQVFMDPIFKLYGMPTSIVSDQDSTFTIIFWWELFKIEGA